MSNIRTILISAGVLAFLVWLILFFSLNSRLGEAIERLEAAELKMDSTLKTLSTAKSTIDSVQRDLLRFGTYVRDIQGRVEILDLTERVGKTRFRNQRTDIVDRLGSLYKEIETTGKELPEIPVVGKME